MPAALITALVYALHQDVWFWRTARPLVFGFLPIGLFYHAVYTVSASVLMWFLAIVSLVVMGYVFFGGMRGTAWVNTFQTIDVVSRVASGTTVVGLLPVVPMTLISALLMFVVSLLTPAARPSPATLTRYTL